MGKAIQGSAEFCERYSAECRTRLDRWWETGPRALVCMANPSYAGEDKNDPTIHRLIELTKALGYPGFTVVNWLPYIATAPKDLFAWRDRFSRENYAGYREFHTWAADLIVCPTKVAAARFIAWGNLVPHVPHTQQILEAMSECGRYDLLAFDVTKDGSPKHPMARGQHRIVAGQQPVIWRAALKEVANA